MVLRRIVVIYYLFKELFCLFHILIMDLIINIISQDIKSKKDNLFEKRFVIRKEFYPENDMLFVNNI